MAAKPKKKVDVEALAKELVAIHRKHTATFARMDDIKSQLKMAALGKGENLKFEFTGLGQVKVSRAKGKELKGIIPEVKAEVFLKLTDAKRDKLIADGVIVMAEQWSNPYYGSVTVETF